jgi:carboxyl-terminal processing protease
MRFAVLIGFAIFAGRGWAQEDPEGLAGHVRRFAQVFALLEENAADEVDVKAAFENGAIPAALRKLDPHTVFFNKDQFEQLREMQTSTRKGFGSIVSVLPGRVIILQTMPGSPSARAGLSPGDEIIAINNVPLSRFDMEQMVEYLAYTRQKEALLHVRRQNFPRPLEFVLSPQTLDAPTVERSFYLEDGIGYIRVGSFETHTGRDFAAAVEKLGGNRLQGLVVDLRNNSGGVFTSALEMAAVFLPPGTRITSIKGRAKKEEVVNAPMEGAGLYQFPLAVVMNEKSASASEVFGAALQENGRAKIVGGATYGKGLVQGVFPLSGGTGLALTTAYYYTPRGRSLQRKLDGAQIDPTLASDAAGIKPDIPAMPEASTRLRAFLEQNALITGYATEWVQKQAKPGANWKLPLNAIDQYRTWLAAKNVMPTLAEWSWDRDWILSRLEQEILNLSVGVDRGDEVEARNDAQVKAAWAAVKR